VLLTGATGFLGMEVLARLLERGDREVIALVRAADRHAAGARLDAVLQTLWRDPAPYRDRVRAVAGDLTSPGLGLRQAERTDLSAAVVRPRIVMGESDSGWTPAFNVLYWPLRAFSRGLFAKVPARAEARVDVVPVDYVADAIVHLLDRSEAGVFNLVSGRGAP